ncbi:extracellular solute-binding protein [Nonomuraea sp. 3N208]|uniref:extracellular solute-binding protein n=1 Tax=Nonomuraea sp. 3N208 TaxID=3457421 RepID=UPI003FCD10CB
MTLKMVAADYGDGPTAENAGAAFWKDVVDQFQAANPNIKIDVQVINWNDIDMQVATMVQNNQVPDILQSGDYSGFAKEGLLHKVDEIVSPNVQQDLLTKFAEYGKTDGTAYGLPFVSSARAMFYNKDLFTKAGNGGAYKDASGKWAISSPQNVETMTYVKGLVDAGLTTPNPGTKDRKTVWEDFAAGKVGTPSGPRSTPRSNRPWVAR